MSKTKVLILPLTFTLGGEIQKILDFFNLIIANATPTDIVAGNAGGTVIVIRSKDLSISDETSVSYAIKAGSVLANPMIPTKAIIPTKTRES